MHSWRVSAPQCMATNIGVAFWRDLRLGCCASYRPARCGSYHQHHCTDIVPRVRHRSSSYSLLWSSITSANPLINNSNLGPRVGCYTRCPRRAKQHWHRGRGRRGGQSHCRTQREGRPWRWPLRGRRPGVWSLLKVSNPDLWKADTVFD